MVSMRHREDLPPKTRARARSTRRCGRRSRRASTGSSAIRVSARSRYAPARRTSSRRCRTPSSSCTWSRTLGPLDVRGRRAVFAVDATRLDRRGRRHKPDQHANRRRHRPSCHDLDLRRSRGSATRSRPSRSRCRCSWPAARSSASARSRTTSLQVSLPPGDHAPAAAGPDERRDALDRLGHDPARARSLGGAIATWSQRSTPLSGSARSRNTLDDPPDALSSSVLKVREMPEPVEEPTPAQAEFDGRPDRAAPASAGPPGRRRCVDRPAPSGRTGTS